jgi:DNA-binding MarR family transcriptional regulator
MIPEETKQLMELIEETILLFRRLRVISSALHGDGIPIAGQRGVLMDLANGGPQTVPAMARVRGVSRQNIQVLIDRFLSEGFVELIENPAHKRSKLVRLTTKGRKLTDEMTKRETEMLASLDVKIPAAQIENTTNVLRSFRDSLQKIPMEEDEKSK